MPLLGVHSWSLHLRGPFREGGINLTSLAMVIAGAGIVQRPRLVFVAKGDSGGPV
ncbi:MAG: hypothetical protein ACREX3_13450 [Gammaproteobacteria bacterium]